MAPKQPERYTVTAALPYTNGPVHIGHLAGCYLPADIYVRYLRSGGEEVAFICGSDEHGAAILLKAMKEGISPQELVDKYHPLIRDSFQQMGISFDVYSRTTSPVHYETAQDFFLTLYEKGVFSRKTSEQFYDTIYSQFLADRYIYGTCPVCGYEKAYGDQCERCGTSLDPTDLIAPKSILSDAAPELRETTHYYLPLQNYQKWCEEYILGEHTKDWKTNVLGQCRAWLQDGLRERSITRDLKWGVPVPEQVPGHEGKVLYVWLDAPIGYISATKEWADAVGKDWRTWWQDENTKLVHFIGKDNIVFHCIIFPVVLHAHGDFIVPDNVPANEFLNIEGEKVSTSRNWAVWVHEYLEDFPGKEDSLRYVLTSIAPETKDSDFTWSDFQARHNNELAAIYGNLVNRVFVLTHNYFGGKVPSRGQMLAAEADLKSQIEGIAEKVSTLLQGYRFREAQSEMINLARLVNKYLTDQEPWKKWKTDPDRTATILHYSLQLLANLCILTEPFLPFTSQKLKNMLDSQGWKWKDLSRLDLMTEGQEIGKPEILFDQIPDEAIQAQVDKLHSKSSTPILVSENDVEQDEAKKHIPVKDTIMYDDFSKLDFRIGTIKNASAVPKADRLLQLTVDMGFEERTIVSGIAEHFKPEEIIGQQVCVVVNLAPRKLKGIESQGMILMAEDEAGKLKFMQPGQEVAPGSIVS